MYQVYMGQLALPVTPSSIQMDVKNRNETVELIDGREINLLKRPGLTEIKFDALIPATPYPFAYYDNGFQPPHFFLDSFENMKNAKESFNFKVIRRFSDGGVNFDTETMDVSLESYSILESSENGLDLILSVSLKQYKAAATGIDIIVEEKKDGTVVVSQPPQRPAKKAEKTYTVKKGDTLWGICAKELGNGAKCHEVAKKNGIANARLIHPGQVIRFE